MTTVFGVMTIVIGVVTLLVTSFYAVITFHNRYDTWKYFTIFALMSLALCVVELGGSLFVMSTDNFPGQVCFLVIMITLSVMMLYFGTVYFHAADRQNIGKYHPLPEK